MNNTKRTDRGVLFGAVALSLFIVASICQAQSNPDKKAESDASVGFGKIIPELIPYAYGGNEKLRFDVSYTGGFKIGEIHMEVKSIKDQSEHFVIRSRATTDNGLFSALYPVNDLHVTKVQGPERLPYHYEVWTEEGYNYQAHREYTFDQRKKKVYYQKNDGPLKTYQLEDTTQNEFSSFFASRLMEFKIGQSFLVPTFADKKRNEVLVNVKGHEQLEDTLFGTVDTTVIEPIMKFEGIYDKRGDTVIWYTNDVCRVPVKLNSKIVIGSLTAVLVAYSNPSCGEYDGMVKEKYQEGNNEVFRFTKN